MYGGPFVAKSGGKTGCDPVSDVHSCGKIQVIVLEESSFSGKRGAQESVEATITEEAKFVVRDGGRSVQMLRPEIQIERRGVVPCLRIPTFVNLGAWACPKD